MARPKKKKPPKRKPAAKKPPKAPDIDIAIERRKADESALVEYYRRIKVGEALKPFEHAHRREIEERINQDDATPATGDVLQNTAALREYTGWTRRVLSYQIGLNVHANADGSFNKQEVDTYLAKRAGKKPPEPVGQEPQEGGGACESVDVQAKKADLRWRNARAEKEEILTAQIRGSMFSQNEVLTAWVERVLNVCSGLESLADRLPPLLAGLSPKDMQPIIKNEVRLLREGFAENGKYTPKN